ncbi:MAG: tRNA (guanine37-N1)-methyltransferase [Archaeoglobi archaeon]|nr:tRNA (guanine37-N1)-methyltransferase [Archaeoglobi archaeon]MDK2781422.1 tRNA (guanine37-N1)-methyltransferase [Archaeoglobi archaeon]
MHEQSLAVKVPKKEAESFRQRYRNIIRSGLKVLSDETHVYFPVASPVEGYEMLRMEFPRYERRSVSEILGYSPSFEIIGDIAILEEGGLKEAEAIMKVHKNVRVVLRKAGEVSGEFRVRKYEFVAGERRTETLHREYGNVYRVDLSRVYFNPHLANERQRIAKMCTENEIVLDMFAGVGPFTIPVARRVRWVYSVEKNPFAVSLLKENLRLNRIENVTVIEGDAMDVVLESRVHRVIMNLPHDSERFLSSALRNVLPGGVIHLYLVLEEKRVEEKKEELSEKFSKVSYRVVHSYSPSKNIYVFDLVV